MLALIKRSNLKIPDQAPRNKFDPTIHLANSPTRAPPNSSRSAETARLLAHFPFVCFVLLSWRHIFLRDSARHRTPPSADQVRRHCRFKARSNIPQLSNLSTAHPARTPAPDPAWLPPAQRQLAAAHQIAHPQDPEARAAEAEAEAAADEAGDEEGGAGAEEEASLTRQPKTNKPSPQQTARPSPLPNRPRGYSTSRSRTTPRTRSLTTTSRSALSAQTPSATTRSPHATTSPATSAPCA